MTIHVAVQLDKHEYKEIHTLNSNINKSECIHVHKE